MNVDSVLSSPRGGLGTFMEMHPNISACLLALVFDERTSTKYIIYRGKRERERARKEIPFALSLFLLLFSLSLAVAFYFFLYPLCVSILLKNHSNAISVEDGVVHSGTGNELFPGVERSRERERER